MEMESFAGGVVSKLLVEPEDIVIAGDAIAIIVEKENVPDESSRSNAINLKMIRENRFSFSDDP